MRVRTGTSMRDIMLGSHDDDDEMYGYDGADELYGYAGNDLLYGGDGPDDLYGGPGADLLDGGPDLSDWAHYEDAKPGVYVRLDTGAGYTGDAAGDILIGIENLSGSHYDDILVGGNVGLNQLKGNGGNDLLFGLGDVDVLDGGTGDDHLWGGPDRDYLYGGAGYDFVRYDDASTGVDVRLDEHLPGTTEAGAGWAGADAVYDSIRYDVEGLVGSRFDDHLVGADPAPGGRNPNNTLFGLDGNDELFGKGGDDVLIGGEGADRLYGGTGFDYARYDDSGAGVYVNLEFGAGYSGTAFNDRLVGIEGLVGSGWGDTLIGDAEDNLLDGGNGRDVLQGRGGNDGLTGGNDDDVLEGGLGGDWLDGGDGFDVASYEYASSSVAVDLGAGLGFGRGTLGEARDDVLVSIESVVGSIHADTLTGDDRDNVLRGGQGADTLTGGFGNDRFDFHPGDLWSERDVIRDFATTAGNSDTLVFYGIAASDLALTDDGAGVRISVLDPAFGGDILVLGVTSAQLTGHLLFA